MARCHVVVRRGSGQEVASQESWQGEGIREGKQDIFRVGFNQYKWKVRNKGSRINMGKNRER
mgnify:CR=1 FL=1